MRYWMSALIGVSVTFAAPVLAHHSTAAYDQTRTITLQGVVKRFQWTNPHSYIDLEVQGGGKTAVWAIEVGAPNLNARAGWKRDDIKAGERIVAIVHPMRDGSPGATLAHLTKADGRVLRGAAEFLRPPS